MLCYLCQTAKHAAKSLYYSTGVLICICWLSFLWWWWWWRMVEEGLKGSQALSLEEDIREFNKLWELNSVT